MAAVGEKMQLGGARARTFALLLWCGIVLVLLCSQATQVHLVQISNQSQTQRRDRTDRKIDGLQSGGAASGKSGDSTSATIGSEAASTSSGSSKKVSNPKRKLGECEYVKSPWEECQGNGTQRRTLRLKDEVALARGQHASNPNNRCDSMKTIERQCKPVGCKYARGEWSSSCADGKRSRVDTLLGLVGSAKGGPHDARSRCPARRTVRKDCRRTCHYVKSAWSECADGFKTRNLTLNSAFGDARKDDPARRSDDELVRAAKQLDEPDLAAGCPKERLIRRHCRQRADERGLTSVEPSAAAAEHQQQSGSGGGGGGPRRTITTIQKRRLQKQQKLLQQARAAASSSAAPPASGAPTPMKLRKIV